MSLATLLLLGCGRGVEADTAPSPLPEAVVDSLSMARIKADVDLLASDAFQGRAPGSEGHREAVDWLAQRMGALGLEPLVGGDFAMRFPLEGARERWTLDGAGQVVPAVSDTGTNLVGVLPGASRPEELLVLVSHFDHLGVDAEGRVYNGAFDDMVAVAASLELARALIEGGVRPARSLVFLFTDAEESGLLGAEAWLADPAVSAEDVVFAVSLDPLGRPILPDFQPLVLLGLERSPALRADWEALLPLAEGPVALVNRAPILGYASDQDSFWARPEPIPALWFTSPGMTWYHTVDDDPQTIDYRGLRQQLRFLARAVAWFGEATRRYEDLGPQPLSLDDARHGAALMRGVLASEEPAASERSQAERLLREFEDMVEDGEVPEDAQALYLQAAIFLLFELTAAHPGEVPPPFPAEG